MQLRDLGILLFSGLQLRELVSALSKLEQLIQSIAASSPRMYKFCSGRVHSILCVHSMRDVFFLIAQARTPEGNGHM